MDEAELPGDGPSPDVEGGSAPSGEGCDKGGDVRNQRLVLLLAFLGVAVAGTYATTRIGKAPPPNVDLGPEARLNSMPRGTHPDFDWTGTLRRALEGADRLEVRPVSAVSVESAEKGAPPQCIAEGAD